MCGIAGIVDFGSAVDPRRVARMSHLLRHRGPDGSGLWHQPQVALGSRRLAIVDVPNGRQPASNEDGSIRVIFNGEIYNHRDLRRGLAACGHRFDSRSDGEVLPHLYEERGPDFVDDLDGDFAIALWDHRRRRLLLARDRVGVKPLFYHERGERIVFASEIKGIFASGLCDIAMDPQGLSDCFFYSHPVAPGTFWRGVNELPPGTTLHFDQHGSTQRRYFTPFQRADPDRPLLTGQAAVEAFAETFTAAVRKRIPDEVRGGVALSGGLDSSAIAAVAARLCHEPLATSSIRLADGRLDETRFSRQVAQDLALPNHEVEMTGERACELLPLSLWHFESPFWFGAVATPFLELTRVARAQGFKVALSGDGSDELLAGYDFYRLMQLDSVLTRWRMGFVQPAIWRGAVRWLGGPAGIDRHILDVNSRLGGYQRQYGEVPAWIYLWSAVGAVARPLLAGDSLPPPSPLPAPPAHDQLRRRLHFEFHTRLPNWVLTISDRVGMANGVEVRVPYLDRDVIDLCGELAPQLLIRRGVEKYVLRQAFAGVVPDTAVRRRKRPFMTPIAGWYLSGPGQELAGHYLSPDLVRRYGLFDPAETQRLWRTATEARNTWRGTVSEWVALMVLSTHIVLEQFTSDSFTVDPI